MTISVEAARDVGLKLLIAAAQISSMAHQVSVSGRDTLSQEELSAIRRLHDEVTEDAERAIAGILGAPRLGNVDPASITPGEPNGAPGQPPPDSEPPLTHLIGFPPASTAP